MDCSWTKRKETEEWKEIWRTTWKQQASSTVGRKQRQQLDEEE